MLRLALAQLAVSADKAKNVAQAVAAIGEAAARGAQVIALPECFNSPYGTKFFPEYAEPIPGPTTAALAKAAADNNVYVIGGSIPEIDAGSLYNTATAFDRTGTLIAKHRKVHLFDIDIPGKIAFRESEVLSPGNAVTTFDTDFGKIGLAICYDIRFPELAHICANQGCRLLVYPGAFNMTTGPAHWELLLRARALDNQLFVAGVSPARDPAASYIAWGHSTVVGPWGDVLATAAEAPAIIYADLDLAKVGEVRSQIPVRSQRRLDLYSVAAELTKSK